MALNSDKSITSVQADDGGLSKPPAPYKTWAAYYAALAAEVAPASSATDPGTKPTTQAPNQTATPAVTPPNATQIGSQIGQISETPKPVTTTPSAQPIATTQTPAERYASVAAEAPIDTAQVGAKIGQMTEVNNPAPTPSQAVSTPAASTPAPTTETPATVEKTSNPTVSSFGDWYKQNYGTDFAGGQIVKKDGMSAADYAIGLNLYYTEQADQKLKTSYDDQLKAVAASQSKDEQQAYILYEKMKKYLGMASAASGQRASSGDMLKATNQYKNNLSGISEQYGAQRGNLDTAYQENALDNQKTTQQNLYELYAKQESDAKESSTAADETKAYTGALVQGKMEDMIAGFTVNAAGQISYTDYQKLEAYYEKYKNKIDDIAKAELEFILENTAHGEPVTPTNSTEVVGDVATFIGQGAGATIVVGGQTYKYNSNGVGLTLDKTPTADGEIYNSSSGATWISYQGKWYRVTKA